MDLVGASPTYLSPDFEVFAIMTMTDVPEVKQPMTVPGAVSVLVVDGLPLATYGLRALVDVTKGLAWCGAARSMDTALTAIRRVRPDVVVVDSRLDRDAGGTRQLLNMCPGLRVVGLVGEGDGEYVRAARAVGVHGLLARSAAPGLLVAAIRAVRAGRSFVDPELAPIVAGPTASNDCDEPRLLSARQHQILTMIACGQRNAEIAQRLFVSVETVRTHVKEILRRLRAKDRAHAIARGYQLGLLGCAEPVVLPARDGDLVLARNDA